MAWWVRRWFCWWSHGPSTNSHCHTHHAIKKRMYVRQKHTDAQTFLSHIVPLRGYQIRITPGTFKQAEVSLIDGMNQTISLHKLKKTARHHNTQKEEEGYQSVNPHCVWAWRVVPCQVKWSRKLHLGSWSIKNILGQWFRGSSSSNKFKNLTSENEQQHSNSSTETPAQQQRHSNSERHSSSDTAAATQQQRHSSSDTATAIDTATAQQQQHSDGHRKMSSKRSRRYNGTQPNNTFNIIIIISQKNMPWNCKCYLILIGPSKKLLLKL